MGVDKGSGNLPDGCNVESAGSGKSNCCDISLVPEVDSLFSMMPIDLATPHADTHTGDASQVTLEISERVP